ncbi:hypothetical protein HML84_19205 [Alcanivorax sp. IO_7]|nr:hypothetical protein HML84_19205 [Alcanivorax sp. IO_7]
MPWPLRNRDAVLEARVTQIHETSHQQVVVSLRNRPALLPPDPDYLRLPALTGSCASAGWRRMNWKCAMSSAWTRAGTSPTGSPTCCCARRPTSPWNGCAGWSPAPSTRATITRTWICAARAGRHRRKT